MPNPKECHAFGWYIAGTVSANSGSKEIVHVTYRHLLKLVTQHPLRFKLVCLCQHHELGGAKEIERDVRHLPKLLGRG